MYLQYSSVCTLSIGPNLSQLSYILGLSLSVFLRGSLLFEDATPPLLKAGCPLSHPSSSSSITSPRTIQKTAQAKGPSESTVTHVPSKLDDPSACNKTTHLCWPHYFCHIAVVFLFSLTTGRTTFCSP